MIYTVTTILSTETIGDSLSTVNQNYLNLDKRTTSISLSTEQNWLPLISLYENNKKTWGEVITLVHQYSARWLNATTTVETLSAHWNTPISIFYPEIFPSPFSPDNLLSVTNFVRTHFPIEDPTFIELPIVLPDSIQPITPRPQNYNPKPNYIEGQTLIIYSYTHTLLEDVINYNATLSDFTICATNPRTVSLKCVNTYTGWAPCNSGPFYCRTVSNGCWTSRNVNCRYDGSPYENIVAPPAIPGFFIASYTTKCPRGFTARKACKVGKPQGVCTRSGRNVKAECIPNFRPITSTPATSFVARASIRATIDMQYSDRFENERITGIMFVVKNCQWEFFKYI
jgi:hypothetical protein